MPKLKSRMPKMCDDRGRAYSCYNGERIYHGVTGTPEAKRNYDKFIHEITREPLPSGQIHEIRSGVDLKSGVMIVAELSEEFLKYHEPRLRKADLGNIKTAVGFLVSNFGDVPVNQFSPKKLRTVRDEMVRSGRFCRNTVNNYTTKIIRIFSWGCEEEFVNASVAGALKMVKQLPKGEYGTFDHEEREDVPFSVILATIKWCCATIAAMIQIQYLLGFRPNEVFSMRVGDIDKTRGNGLWYYVPGSYKTGRFVGKIEFPLSSPVQELLEPFLIGKKSDQAVFSPAQAVAERKATKKAAGRTKPTPSRVARDAKRAANSKRYKEFYDKNSYRNAIKYAIQKANRHLPDAEKIPHWCPYQLRNSAATQVELEHGLDESQAQLGHKSADMTRRYSRAQLQIRERLALEQQVNPFANNPESSGSGQE